MYTAPGPHHQNFLGTEVRPRQNYWKDKEEIFLCTYTDTILYRKQKCLGMLSPYAPLYYPLTETRMEEETKPTEEKEEIKDIKLKELKNEEPKKHIEEVDNNITKT